MIRRAAVAGYFYQGSPESLRKQVAAFLAPDTQKLRALGVLSPHAGLMYSGSVAGAVYSRIDIPGRIVLIGPNHTGLGAPVSIMTDGEWQTPLGSVAIDEQLARAILANSRVLQDDVTAHLREHSLEVQLPFIQYLRDDVKIVPIQMMDTRLETCLELGRAVAEAVKEGQGSSSNGQGVLIVASSDMSHYISAENARKKDHLAIEKVLALDPEGLYYAIRNEGITMCGYGPAVSMLAACKGLGATRADLVKYSNSGEVSGDFDNVVGYAGIVVT